jgi:small GTP-binding protein
MRELEREFRIIELENKERISMARETAELSAEDWFKSFREMMEKDMSSEKKVWSDKDLIQYKENLMKATLGSLDIELGPGFDPLLRDYSKELLTQKIDPWFEQIMALNSSRRSEAETRAIIICSESLLAYDKGINSLIGPNAVTESLLKRIHDDVAHGLATETEAKLHSITSHDQVKQSVDRLKIGLDMKWLTLKSMARIVPKYSEAKDLKKSVILLGKSGSGKTSLIEKYTSGRFWPHVGATVGVHMKDKTLQVWGKSVKLMFLDTSGQDRFDSISKSFFRKAQAALLLYDVQDRVSFELLTKYIDWMREHQGDDEPLPWVLIGTKNDEDTPEGKAVPTEEGKAFALKYGVPFLETSALRGVNIELGFETVAKRLVVKESQQGWDTLRGGDSRVQGGVISLTEATPRQERRGSCC